MQLLALLITCGLVCSAQDTAADWEMRGAALKAQGDATGALDAYQRAAALDPDSAPIQDEVGFLLAVLNRRQEANILHMHRVIDRYLTTA